MKPFPITFLIGSEPLQESLFLEKIRAEAFPEGLNPMNDHSFTGKEITLEAVFDLANTFPMFGGDRFIVLRHLPEPKAADEEVWLRYLEAPAASTRLVVTMAKIDKRKRLYRALSKSSAVQALAAPRPQELPRWIDQLASRHGVTLETAARKLLAELIGTDLTAIDHELEKLALFVHPKTQVSESHVGEMVLRATGDNIFAFTDQVVEKRTGEAMGTLSHLVEEGTPVLVLTGMLARHLRMLLKTGDAMKRGIRGSELASKLAVPPFVATRYREQAQKMEPTRLVQALDHLCHLDRDLKSTGLPAKLLMERTIRAMAG